MSKKTSYIKLYRSFFNSEISNRFTDQEFRLFLTYVQAAGWDTRHKENFGIVSLTQKQIKENFLNRWSVGKISETRKSLINKGFLKKLGKGKIKVANMPIFQDGCVQRVERMFRAIENGIQVTELEIQFFEDKDKEMVGAKLRRERNMLRNKFSVQNSFHSKEL